MIYDGKKASLILQEQLRLEVSKLEKKPVLAIVSVSTHPSIASFIKIKKRFGDAIGVVINEYNFKDNISEENLIEEIQKVINSKLCDAIIIQLPLPTSYNTKKVLDILPPHLDVDVLGEEAITLFKNSGNPIPPVAGAVAYILNDTKIDIKNKKIVIIGHGKLVGEPVSIWLQNQGIEPSIIDINTDEETRMKLYKEADIVISGIGQSHHLKKEFFKDGVVIIDAGTSDQAGTIAGDCDPACVLVASIITPVPGGVGPLTVAHLFKNIINLQKK